MICIPSGDASELHSKIDSLVDDYSDDLKKKIKLIEDALVKLHTMKTDLAPIRMLLNEANDALSSGSVEKFSDFAKRCSEELERVYDEAIMNGLDQINKYIDASKKMDLDVNNMAAIFKKVNEGIKNKDHNKTIDAIKTYTNTIEKILTNKVSDAINEARTQVRSAESLTDMSDARELIRHAVSLGQKGEFDKALQDALQAKNTVKKALETEAKNIFNFAMEKMKSLKSSGMDLTKMDSMRSEANTAIQNEDWIVLMNLSEKILEEIEVIQPQIAEDLFAGAKLLIVDVKKAGMETKDLLEYLNISKKALEDKDYKKCVKYTLDIKIEGDKRLGVYKGANEVLSKVSMLISDAKKLGINVTNIIQNMLTAKRYFDSRDYKNSTQIGLECIKELNEQIKIMSAPLPKQEPAAQRQPVMHATKIKEPPKIPPSDDIEKIKDNFQQIQSFYTKMKTMGDRLDSVEGVLLEIEDAITNGKPDKASDAITKSTTLMKTKINEFFIKLSSDIDGILETVPIDETEIADIKRLIQMIRDEIEKDNITSAVSLINSFVEEIEKIVHTRIIEKLTQLDRLTKEANSIENEIVHITSRMMATTTFHKFDYKSTLDFLQTKNKKSDTDRDALIKLIVSIRKKVEEAKKLGVDIKEFKDTLNNIIETIRNGNLDTAMKNAVEVETKLNNTLSAHHSKLR